MIVIRRWFFAIVLVFGIASPGASDAFFDPPYITPAKPSAGEEVSVSIYGGFCDPIFGSPGYPKMVRDGNRITVTHYGARYTDPELCFYTPGTEVTRLGTFVQGAYDVEVRLDYIDGYGDFQSDVIGVTSFAVAGILPPNQRAYAAPALGGAAILLLIVLLPGLVAVVLQARSSGI